MKRTAARTALLLALTLFAVGWTLLMGLGAPSSTSSLPAAADSGREDASEFGAGAHIMYVDESEFPTITLFLAVNDPAGAPMLDLSQDAFTLREDGEEVAISRFVSAGGGATSSLLVIDQSGSMEEEGKLAGAVEAGQSYIDYLKVGADQLGVIVFSDQAVTLAPVDVLTEAGRAAVKNLLGTLAPLDGTEFYAATRIAISALEEVKGRKVVIALTDGLDNQAQAGLNATVDQARDARVPVFTVGLGANVDRDGLQQLADQTGGQAYFSPTASELQALYQAIATSLRNEYAVSYSSLAPNLDGTQRNLAVEIGNDAGDLSATGGYSVGGILASSFDWLLFTPTFLLAFVLLLALLWAPTLHKWRAERRVTQAKTQAEVKARESTQLPTVPEIAGASASSYSANLPDSAPSPGKVQPILPLVARSPDPLATSDQASLTAGTSPTMFPVQLTEISAAGAPTAHMILELPLRGTEAVIGSALPSNLLVMDPSIAVRHARIFLSGTRFVVEDLTGLGGLQVAFRGDLADLHRVQSNALRDGSLLQLGAVQFTFRQIDGNPPQLERRYLLAQEGLVIGTDASATIRVAEHTAQAAVVRHDGNQWMVERLIGVCQVAYQGDATQLRPVSNRNALKPGSRIQVGETQLRLEE